MNRKIAIMAGIFAILGMIIVTYFRLKQNTIQSGLFSIGYAIVLVGYGICLAISEIKK